jgi:hypothetical protein
LFVSTLFSVTHNTPFLHALTNLSVFLSLLVKIILSLISGSG